MENKRYVAVGSQNRAKLEAVRFVFDAAFENIDVVGYEVASGIAMQPITDEDSIVGATNRARSVSSK